MASATDEFEFYSDRSQASTLESKVSRYSENFIEELPPWTIPEGRTTQCRQYWNIRQELYDSERAYLRYLCIIQKLFINPLAKFPNMVSRTDLRTLFGDLTSIYMVNKELLSNLRSCSTVYESFTSLVPFLKLYTAYAANYTKGQRIYNKLMQKEEFRLFIEEQEATPVIKGIKFMALLIMPVQRIPRYILLLKRLHEETKCAEERVELEKVLRHMNDITDLLDSCIKEFENGEELWDIQESLGLKEGIMEPGRRLVKQGVLFKRNLCGEATYHERYFWLFNDILVYGKRRIGMGPKYECSCIFLLRHVQLAYNCYEGSLQIKCKSHSLSLTSDSYESVCHWNDTLKEAIDRSRVLRSTLRKESSLQPVREFKTQIRKRLTKKFMNTNYVYKVTDKQKQIKEFKKKWANVLSSPSDINVMDSTVLQSKCSTSHGESSAFSKMTNHFGLRKRKLGDTSSDFDKELSDVVRRRRLFSEDDKITELVEDRENVPTKTTDPVYLTKPQIRKYSYMENDKPAVPEVSSATSSKGSLPISENTNQKIPWWVTEAQPAEYRQNPRRSGIMGSTCSIL